MHLCMVVVIKFNVQYEIKFPTNALPPPPPQVAAAWCLLTQDLLMWQDWPAQLLALPQFREEWSGGGRGSGTLVFRGPRMR
jgi:hypothetical protein